MGQFDDLVPKENNGFADLVPRDRVVATTPDGGRVVESPDGTRFFTSPAFATSDPKLINRILEGATPAEVSKTGPVSSDGNILRQVFQGLTVGTGDEITAYGTSKLGGNSYETELARERARIEQGRSEAPISSLVGNVAGGLAPGAAIYRGLAAGARGVGAVASEAPGLLARIGLGAAAGGTEGAVYGFNAGEGDATARGENAKNLGAVGAVFGAAAPAALALARPLFRGVAGIVTKPFNKSANTVAASRLIERSVGRAGATPDKIERLLQEAADEGQPQFSIADALGPAGRGTLNAAVRQPGAAKTEAVDFLMKRQAGQGERISASLADALGVTETAAQKTTSLTAARKTASDTAFDAARTNARPVDVRGVLEAINGRLAPTKGVAIAPDSIDAALGGFKKRLTSRSPATDNVPGMGRDPTATAVDLSDFNKVFRVRQDMRDAREAAIRSGAGEKAKEIGAIIKSMDEALANASDEYRAAMADHSSASRVIEAVDAGKTASALRVRPQDTAQEFGGLQPNARDAYKTGYADPLLAAIESAAPGVNKARPLQSDKRAAELGQMAVEPARLFRIIQREMDMFATGNRVLGGSATADNFADVADAARGGARALGEAVVSPVLGLRRALGSVVDFAVNGATGQNEATRAVVARDMLGRDVRGALQPAAEARQAIEMYDGLLGALTRSGSVRAAGEPSAKVAITPDLWERGPDGRATMRAGWRWDEAQGRAVRE